VNEKGKLICPKPLLNSNYIDNKVYTIDDIKSRTRHGTPSISLNAPLTIKDVKIDDPKIYSRLDMKSSDRIKPSAISIARHPDKKVAIDKVLDDLGGMCSFVKKDDLVAIKLNICGGTPTINGTYTPKDTASIIGDKVRECGGKPVFFDSSMIWTDMYPIAKDEGYIEWRDKNKEDLRDINNAKKIPWVKFDFGDDTVVGVGNASKLLVDADVIINVPVMKTHILSSVTMGMKNMYGAYPEADKGKFHAKGLNESIVAINRAFKPNLTIIDGSVGCDGGGPLSCNSLENDPYNTFVASTDVVCADALASKLIGHDKPMNIQHIRLAHQNGTGNAKCYEDAGIRFNDDGKIIMKDFTPHDKDGKWSIVSPEFADSLEKNMETMGMGMGGADFMNVVSDIFLGGFAYYGGGMMPSIWNMVLKFQDDLGTRAKIKPMPPLLHEHELDESFDNIYPK